MQQNLQDYSTLMGTKTKDEILQLQEPRSRAERKRLGLPPLTSQSVTTTATTTTEGNTNTSKDGQGDNTNIKLPDWVTNYPFKTDTDNEDVEDDEDVEKSITPQEGVLHKSDASDIVNTPTQFTDYDSVYKHLTAGRDYNKEIELEKRREKIGRIADGINAMYNIYTRARGVEPVVTTAPQQYSNRAQARKDMLEQQQQRNAAATLQYIMREREKEEENRLRNRQLARQWEDLYRLNNKQDFEERKHDDMMNYRNDALDAKTNYQNRQAAIGETNAGSNRIRANKARDWNAEPTAQQSGGNSQGARGSRYQRRTQTQNNTTKKKTGINWK